MGRWVARQGMHLKPYRCVACGQTPRDDDVEGRPVKQAYFCEGVDVNWGDSVFLCDSCVRVLGELRGMMDVKQADRLKGNVMRYEARIKELEEERDTLQARIDRMLDGVRAKKEAQQARTSKKRKAAA